MRLRNVPGAREAIAENEYCVQEPEQYKGNWRAMLFHNDNPLHVEIGMGKGDFIIELAETHPEINFIGIEKFSSVLFRAVEKLESRSGISDRPEIRHGAVSDERNEELTDGQNDISNLYFIRFDATELATVFAPGEVDRIYLNFSDPWPKDRHAKRRLTSPQFLELYDRILSADGIVQFKTDNRALFDYSVEVVENSGQTVLWSIREITYDLHENGNPPGNVMTEYEKKFVGQGHPICRMVIDRKHLLRKP